MLVAVSLIAISLSVFIYRYPYSTWRSLLAHTSDDGPLGRTGETTPNGDAKQSRSTGEGAANAQNCGSVSSLETGQDVDSPRNTPKAAASLLDDGNAIPTFTLAAHDSSEEDEDDHLPPPSFPAINSAQRASTQFPMPAVVPPSKPALMAPPPKPTSSFMAPPTRVIPSNLRALPRPSQSMHVPTTGPLPNRGPAPNRGTLAVNLALPVKTPALRGKVLLSPGHSPLDWAHKQRSGENLSGVSSVLRVTPSMLKEKNGRKGKPAWSSYQGKVYNITPYLPFHPGGVDELRRAAGKDGGKLFAEVHPWVNWDNMLGECLVGIMVAEDQRLAISTLEDMD